MVIGRAVQSAKLEKASAKSGNGHSPRREGAGLSLPLISGTLRAMFEPACRNLDDVFRKDAGGFCRLDLAVYGLEGEIKPGGNFNSYYDDPHDATGRSNFVLANPRQPKAVCRQQDAEQHLRLVRAVHAGVDP